LPLAGGGVAREVAGVLNQAAQIGAEFVARDRDAKRNHLVSQGVSALTGQISDLQQQAASDPDISGSTERFDLGVAASIEAIQDQFDTDTAAEISLRSAKFLASTRASVANTERVRFNSNARLSMAQLTDNYIDAAATAQTDLAREQAEASHTAAIAESDFLPTEVKVQLLDRFQSGVSSSRALRMLSTAPDALAVAIRDPAEFPGLSAEERERTYMRALSAADTMDLAGDRSAQAALKDAQDDNLRDMLARFIANDSPMEIRADILDNSSEFSASGLNTLRTALTGAGATTNDEQTIVNIDTMIRNGDPGTIDAINAAYIGKRITFEARGGFMNRWESRNEPGDTPTKRAYDKIEGSFTLPPFAQFSPQAKAEVEILKAKALREMDLAVREGLTPAQLDTRSTEIVEANIANASIRARKIVRAPFGINKGIDDVTSKDLAESGAMISEKYAKGLMSEELALLLIENNTQLIPIARENELRKTKGK
jgi:hypothetical protein